LEEVGHSGKKSCWTSFLPLEEAQQLRVH
jgi:hypothetical protein